ncbi:MAG: hypothetical protein JWL89_398 [Candidatus Saccharibacteria bacterium]|nr:hypothetical protein [Candidatus Saccharibacteria bacterium]
MPRLNPEEFTANAVSPVWYEDQARHQTAMRELTEPVTLISDDGQQFSGLHINRDFTDKSPVIRINSMFGAADRPDQQYIAYQWGAAYPDRGFVLIDLPSHGASDNLTETQIKEIKKEGTLKLVGKAHVEAVSNRIPHVGEPIIVGEALGARMAAEFVAASTKRDIYPDHMFGFDMPGLENRSSASLAFSYFASALKSRKYNAEGEANDRLKAAFEEKFNGDLANYQPRVEKTTTKKQASVYKHQKSLLTFLLRNSPLNNDKGADALSEGLQSNPNLAVNLVFGGLSAVGRWRRETAARVQKIADANNHRLQAEVWPSDDQGMGLAPLSPRLVAYSKAQLWHE